ncbi:MAG: SHD1 domain-containing protein [Planctomycetota bacterium]
MSAEQIKSVKSSGKRDSTARENLPDKEPATDDQEQEVGAAESEPERTWTSADGKFTVSAKLAGKSGNMVRLIRSNGKTTRIEFEKLSDSDRKYIEAALKKAQSEKASDPFSDSNAESKPAKPPVKSDSERTADQSETAVKRATETEREQATDRARIAEAPSGQPNPQAANAGMPFLVGLFLRFGFSGFIFGPLLLSGIALLAIGLKNANLYY